MSVAAGEIQPLHAPRIRVENVDEALLAKFFGRWVAGEAPVIERRVEDLVETAGAELRLTLDLADIRELDTVGAWIIDRTVRELRSAGHQVEVVNANPKRASLLREVEAHGFRKAKPEAADPVPEKLLIDIGKGVFDAGS